MQLNFVPYSKKKTLKGKTHEFYVFFSTFHLDNISKKSENFCWNDSHAQEHVCHLLKVSR